MLKSSVVVLAAPAVLAFSAMAQPTDSGQQPPAELTPQTRHITSSLDLGYEFHKNADMDKGGDVSVSRYNADVEINAPLGDDSSVSLDFGFEYSNYDFTGVFIIPDTGNPTNQIYSYTAGATLMTPFADQKMSLLVGGGLTLSGELNADKSESMTYRALTGLIYNHDKKISLGLGIIVASQLEDDPLIVPFPIIRYDFDNQWSITTKGPKLELAYDHSESLSFGAYLAWENRSFRLESGMGLSSKAVITENRVPIGIFAVYSPGPGIEIRGDLFSSVYTQYEARSNGQTELGTDNADPSFGFGFSAVFRF